MTFPMVQTSSLNHVLLYLLFGWCKAKSQLKIMRLICRNLIDFMRRYVVTHSVEELFFTICPLGILAVALSMFFGLLMGSIDKYVPPNTSTTLRDLYEVSEASIVQFFLVHRGITEEEVHRLYGTNKYF